MSQLLATQTLRNIQVQFPDLGAVYRRLKAIYGQDQVYSLFAEPVLMGSGDRITWQTDLDGDAKPYNHLNENEQRQADILLQEQANSLFKQTEAFRQDATLRDQLMRCLRTPGHESLYLVSTSGGLRVVLTQWGMVSDVPGSQRGWLHELIYAERSDQIVEVLYRGISSTPVTGFEITCSFEGSTHIEATDEKGRIYLRKVKVNEAVQCSYTDDRTQLSITKEFISAPDGVFQIFLEKPPVLSDMKFQVVDFRNTPLPEFALRLSITPSEKRLSEHTDENGCLTLSKIEIGSAIDIRCIHPSNGEEVVLGPVVHIENFTGPHVLRLPPPKHDMVIQVVNRRNQPVPGADIAVSVPGQPLLNLTSDQDGKITLSRVEEDSPVEVNVKKDRRKGRALLKCRVDTPLYIVQIRGISLLWLLLLLPILALFIPLDQHLTVVVRDGTGDRPPVKNASLQIAGISANSAFLFDTLTNDAGRFECSLGKSTLGKILFSGGVKGSVRTLKSCYGSDSTAITGFFRGEADLTLLPARRQADLVIKSCKSGQSLPEVDLSVQIKSDWGDETRTLRTNLEGRVTLENIPDCSTLRISLGKVEYFDTIYTRPMPFLCDTLLLCPAEEAITFFVRSLENPNPGLPGAKVDASITNSSGSSSTSATVTAVRMGGVNSAGAIDFPLTPMAKIELKASLAGFSDTTLQAQMPDLRNWSAGQRTLYLRPLYKPLNIRVVDAKTGAPVPNAKITILCDGNPVPPERFTNSDGIAQVSIRQACKLLARAESPDYTPGEKQASAASASELTIPLNRIEKKHEILITTKDHNNAHDDTYQLYVDGINYGIIELSPNNAIVDKIVQLYAGMHTISLVLHKDMGNATNATIYAVDQTSNNTLLPPTVFKRGAGVDATPVRFDWTIIVPK